MANYLYNGVDVPALPERDAETFPYIVLWQGTAEHPFNVYYCQSPPIIDSDGKIVYASSALGKCQAYSYWTTDDMGWVGPTNYTAFAGLTTDPTGVFWTNADILNPDGSVFLAASDPIPVGGEPIDPTSFMQGYIVGRRLAGMRK